MYFTELNYSGSSPPFFNGEMRKKIAAREAETKDKSMKQKYMSETLLDICVLLIRVMVTGLQTDV